MKNRRVFSGIPREKSGRYLRPGSRWDSADRGSRQSRLPAEALIVLLTRYTRAHSFEPPASLPIHVDDEFWLQLFARQIRRRLSVHKSGNSLGKSPQRINKNVKIRKLRIFNFINHLISLTINSFTRVYVIIN